jgi:hypothetical protein
MTAAISTLSFRKVVRDGLLRNEMGKDGGKTKRVFLDFVIDGTPLTTKLGTEQITSFVLDIGEWPGSKAGNIETVSTEIKHLLEAEHPDFPAKRWALYRCAECGDLGCTAVSVKIDRSDGAVVWSDFGFQNNWEDEVHAITNLGPFVFDVTQYRSVFEEGLRIVNSQ